MVKVFPMNLRIFKEKHVVKVFPMYLPTGAKQRMQTGSWWDDIGSHDNGAGEDVASLRLSC